MEQFIVDLMVLWTDKAFAAGVVDQDAVPDELAIQRVVKHAEAMGLLPRNITRAQGAILLTGCLMEADAAETAARQR